MSPVHQTCPDSTSEIYRPIPIKHECPLHVMACLTEQLFYSACLEHARGSSVLIAHETFAQETIENDCTEGDM